MSDEADVLRAIDQLRHDLSGYHGQLVAHNDLQRHCDNQRERIVELEGLYAKAKAERDEDAMAFCKEHDRAEFLMRENIKLRELVRDMWGYAVNREMELCNACTCAGSDFCDCSACDEYDGACGIARKRFEELYADRTRELGVEV